MIENTSTFSNSRRPNFVRSRLATVIGIALAVNIILAIRVEADINLAGIVCWQCAPPPGAQAVAVDVRLTILPQLVQNDHKFAKRLGFDGAREINFNPSAIDIDPPFVVLRVGLDRLQSFQPQLHDATYLLLDDTNWTSAPFPYPLRFLFPIKAGTHVRSAVMVSLPLLKNLPPADTKWEIQWIGSPGLIARLTQCGGGANTCDGKTYFIVWIPGLNRYYLGRFHQGEFKLTVLFNDRLGYQAGQELSTQLDLSSLFDRLKIEAAQILSDSYSPPR